MYFSPVGERVVSLRFWRGKKVLNCSFRQPSVLCLGHLGKDRGINFLVMSWFCQVPRLVDWGDIFHFWEVCFPVTEESLSSDCMTRAKCIASSELDLFLMYVELQQGCPLSLVLFINLLLGQEGSCFGTTGIPLLLLADAVDSIEPRPQVYSGAVPGCKDGSHQV